MKGCQTPAARVYWIFLALIAALAGSAALVAAQGGRAARVPARVTRQLSFGERPLVGAGAPNLDMRRINPHDPNALQATVPGAPGSGIRFLAGGSNGPRPVAAPPPYLDVTTVPRPPQVGNSTASHDLHPFY